jgi:hypothetical protein
MLNLTLIRQKTQVLKLVLTPETQSESIIRNEKLFKNFGFNVEDITLLIYGNLHSRMVLSLPLL